MVRIVQIWGGGMKLVESFVKDGAALVKNIPLIGFFGSFGKLTNRSHGVGWKDRPTASTARWSVLKPFLPMQLGTQSSLRRSPSDVQGALAQLGRALDS